MATYPGYKTAWWIIWVPWDFHPKRIYCHNIDEALAACEVMEAKRDSLPFEADGSVIKINDLDLADKLGMVGKDPRGALALKFPAREVTTRCRTSA